MDTGGIQNLDDPADTKGKSNNRGNSATHTNEPNCNRRERLMSNGVHAAGGASMRLHRDDLIDDHELNEVGDDRLSHDGIAEQLALIVQTVDAPANVALFGPWGSGKSGIGNLLKKKVHGKNGIRVARFDAYKYAELPLQRNFVSAVAAELGQMQPKYHDDLYNGRTKTDITVPAATIGKILGIFAILICGLSAILLVLAAVVAAFQKGGFRDDFESHIGTALKAGLVPAVLLSGLVALATKTFQVDRSIAKPESDEQFEKLFTELVADSKAKTLVVFVDELDRCSASEVVETLDTVRTFLGVSKCVFIIAADRHVLEEALTRAAKQETPADDDNPYYSTGSAYLDKVFQYQVSLPPLLTQSVSNFAATLVEGRGGLWADINTPYVLSVLVPTHVTSPRRVKHLINTFALTYRLSEQRYCSGLLAEDPKLHAPAIAKLACLRVEFPLFARHLEVDASLPRLVLELVKNPKASLGPGVTERARELAIAYALENAAPASMMDADLNSEEESTARTPQTPSEGDGEEGVVEADPQSPVRTHNKQLINYLRRTSRVQGPSRALIYQQTSGTVLGLDGDIAQAIESAAEDKDLTELRRLIDTLDQDEQGAAFDLLAQHIRTGVGVAGPNAARSFLLLQQDKPDFVTGRAVDAICESIAHLYDDDSELLDDETIAGAWSLSKQGTDAGSSALRTLIVNDLANTEAWDGSSPAFLLSDTLLALDADRAKATEYIVAHLMSEDGAKNAETLFEMPDSDLIRTIDEIGELLSEQFRKQLDLHRAWKTKSDADAKTPATTTRAAVAAQAAAATAGEPESEPFNPAPVLDSIAQQSLSRETPLQHRIAGFLLTISTVEARNAALRVLQRTETVETRALVGQILTATSRRKVNDWANWLRTISPKAVTTSDKEPVASLYRKAWDAYATGEIDSDTCEQALEALHPLRDAIEEDARPDLSTYAIGTTDFWARDAAEAEALLDVLHRVDLFERYGLIDAAQTATGIVGSLQDTLAGDGAAVTTSDFRYRYVYERGIAALHIAPIDQRTVEGVVAEALDCSWLSEVERTHVALLAIQATDGDPSVIEAIPTPAAIAELITQWGGTTASATATLWVHLTTPSPDDLAPVWEALRQESSVTTEFIGAVEEARQLWAPSDHEAFIRRYLKTPDDLPLSDADERALGLAGLDDSHAASILIDMYGQTTNNAQRRHVVNLWEAASITNDRARRNVFETIIFNMLELNNDGKNAQSAELALDTLGRIGSPLPRNIKGALGAKVESAVGDDQTLNSKAIKVLTRLGYRTTSSGFLGRKKRVDFTQ